MNKEQILKAWRSLPVKTLLNYLNDGTITISDLENSLTSLTGNDRSSSQARVDELKRMFVNREETIWKSALETDSVQSYRGYLNSFGENGKYVKEAEKKIEEKELILWRQLNENPTLEGIKQFKELFPLGNFIDEVEDLSKDLPWYEAKKRNTIEGYRLYQENHPGKHVKDVEKAIREIEDQRDWDTAHTNNSIDGYKEYIKKHPDGQFVSNAKRKIEGRSGEEQFIDELKEDINRYSASKIQEKIENGVTSWDNLETIFNKEQINAIKSYKRPKQLDPVTDMGKLPQGYTEVYFWGLRGTGKTCAIGATIGYLKGVRRSINPIQGPGIKYLYQLQSLFKNDGKVCILPPGSMMTDEEKKANLPNMSFSFKEKDRTKEHRAMLIDVAGEVFSGIFKKMNKLDVDEDEENAIERLKTCLCDRYNNKIHFFIVEYGDDSIVNFDGFGEVNKSAVMQSLAEYFKEEKVFKSSSVSMNILITKCDRIKEGISKKEACQKFLDDSGWGSVVNGLDDIAEKSHNNKVPKIMFSIGNVFAQDLCVFDPSDAEKIVNIIEEYTHTFRNTWLGRLIDFIRG